MKNYGYHLYSSGANYGIKPDFIRSPLDGRKGFVSLYAVTQETSQAIQQEGTTRGFKGVVWSERLWIDVDCYETADTTERRLKEMGYDFVAYDTGGRGAHFGILRSAAPSHLLPARDKQWVTKHFPEADKSIYTHLHPFRLPGTTHEKTGAIKTLVASVAGSVLKLPPLEPEALQVSEARGQGNGRSVFDVWRIKANTVPVSNGERHATLIRLLYALRDEGVTPSTALWWAQEWNKMLSEPKSDDEIEKAVRSIL